MTVNDIDDGHLTIDDDAIAVMPASSPIVIMNVSIVYVMQIDRLTVSCLLQCHHVDLVHAPHVIPVTETKKKRKNKNIRKWTFYRFVDK